jgi:hypothetical protein
MNEEFFSIPICPVNIYKSSLDINNIRLSQEIHNHAQSLEIQESNVNLLENKTSYLNYVKEASGDNSLPEGEECKKLKKLMTEKVSFIAKKPMTINECWSLTLTKGQSVGVHSHKSNTHMHPGEYYSVAYYVNVPPGSAKLMFNISVCNTIETIIPVIPEEGMFLIFNSFIQHHTDRHLSDEPRIVVSANFSPVSPNRTPVPDWSAYD